MRFLALMPNKVLRPKQDAPKQLHGFGAVTVKRFRENKLNAPTGPSMHLLWQKSISVTGSGGPPGTAASGNGGPLATQDAYQTAAL